MMAKWRIADGLLLPVDRSPFLGSRSFIPHPKSEEHLAKPSETADPEHPAKTILRS
jgi:hypothetical protein